MNFGKNYLDFCGKLSLGNWITDPSDNKLCYELTESEFNLLRNEIQIFDGRKGALILGRSHSEGGIHLIQYKPETGKFRLVGEMEGWEFLTAPLTTNEFYQEFESINKSVIPTGMEVKTNFQIPVNCPVIDTEYYQPSLLFVSVNSQYIINRFATREHIETLISVNQRMSANIC